MSAVSTFAFDSAAVRVVMIDGEPWFVGKDVATILGYRDATNAIKQHCKGVVKHHPLQTLGVTARGGGEQEVRVINEPDMLRLVVKSKLPAAERFERWVFEEVLPSIRKTGAYVSPEAPGALGVQAQPMPYLSHVADFRVAADRVFRSVMRSARTAGLGLPVALRRANAVTLESTGIDMLAALDAGEHLARLDAEAEAEAAADADASRRGATHPTAAEFWADWSGGHIDGLPYQTCLTSQAYQAYTHWCALAGQGHVARREAFSTTVLHCAHQAGRPAQIKPMRIGERAGSVVQRVLLVTPPPAEGQGVWVTALVDEFDAVLREWRGVRLKVTC